MLPPALSLLLLLLPPLGADRLQDQVPVPVQVQVAAEHSSRTEPDYDYRDYRDYRGKWCIDDHGFVYGIGEVYQPGPSACPCTCTADGPVCAPPTCPRIHPRCTRIGYRACCPVCQAMARVCLYRGKTYRLLEEFRLSRCERCRCQANRDVSCSVSGCPAPHCVNPSYDPTHCCPICKTGPNCFAGNRLIAAGERVDVDERTFCYCSYQDGTWFTQPQARCEQRPLPSPPPRDTPSVRRLDVIP